MLLLLIPYGSARKDAAYSARMNEWMGDAQKAGPAVGTKLCGGIKAMTIPRPQ
jgi:hypothetical protein